MKVIQIVIFALTIAPIILIGYRDFKSGNILRGILFVLGFILFLTIGRLLIQSLGMYLAFSVPFVVFGIVLFTKRKG